MKLTTMGYGSEVSWTFGPCSSAHAYDSNTVYTEICSITIGTHTLTCIDSYGDGWHGGYMEIEGNRYCDGFSSGYEEVVEVTITGTDIHLNLGFCPITK